MATPTLLTAEGSEGTQPGRSAVPAASRYSEEAAGFRTGLPARPTSGRGLGSESAARAGGPFRGAGRAFSPHLHACVSYMSFTRAAGLTRHDEP